LKEIISSAMHLQSQNALGQAGLLVGRDQLLQLDAQPLKDPIALDDYRRAADELPRIAIKIVDFNEIALASVFDRVREPFRAYHGPRVPL
jgi:hypothetical protein